MGKKRVVQKTEEEVLKESEKIEAKMKKEVKLPRTVQEKEGRIYISSSYNNTIITLTDSKGNVLTWASAGSIGFKGTKKATAFAASKTAEVLCERAKKLKINKVKLFIKGIGSGRDSAARTIAASGLDIVSVADITPIPHNGCRPKKPRRV